MMCALTCPTTIPNAGIMIIALGGFTLKVLVTSYNSYKITNPAYLYNFSASNVI